MSLSSCPRCWDTPCGCGLAGYVVLRDPRLSKLGEGTVTTLQEMLERHLARQIDLLEDLMAKAAELKKEGKL